MAQIFKRYKYTSKTIWGGLLEKENQMGNMDQEITEWMNLELENCGTNAVIISVNTEFIPSYKENFLTFSNRVLVSLCIGIPE